MLSSKNESKVEGRFVARLDVLAERVDTLASTVASTASAMAKKDGEIAALHRALEARDQTLQAVVEHVNRMAQTRAADVPVDATELRSLRNAVAALTKDRAGGVNAEHIQALVATIRALEQRVEALAAAAAAAAQAPVTDPATIERLDALAAELAVMRTAIGRPSEELVAALATLRGQLDGLAALQARTESKLAERLTEKESALDALAQRLEGLGSVVESATTGGAENARKLEVLHREVAESSARIESIADELRDAEAGVSEELLDERLAQAADAMRSLTQRVDRIQSRVESGTAILADKEQRLQALHHEVAESGSRIDSITEDLRNVSARVTEEQEQLLGRLTVTGAALEALGQRVDDLASGVASATTSHTDEEQKLEALHHEVTESSSRIESIADDLREALGAFPEATPDQLDELSTRIDLVEKRVATVAVEVARAKTLWPIALRSLEARLDDVAPLRASDESTGTDAEPGIDARDQDDTEETSDDLLAGLRDSLTAMESVAAELERTAETWPQESLPETPTTAPHQAVAGGARVVPLRTTDP